MKPELELLMAAFAWRADPAAGAARLRAAAAALAGADASPGYRQLRLAAEAALGAAPEDISRAREGLKDALALVTMANPGAGIGRKDAGRDPSVDWHDQPGSAA